MSFRAVDVVISGVVALAAAAAPAWADLKIGVVNYSRLMQESPQAKAAQDALRGEFAGKQKELQTQQQALKSQGRLAAARFGHHDGRSAHRGRARPA